MGAISLLVYDEIERTCTWICCVGWVCCCAGLCASWICYSRWRYDLIYLVLELGLILVVWVGTTGGAGGTVTNVTTRAALIAAVKVRFIRT